MTSIINQEYIKNYLIDNKIIFPTNLHDNVLNGFQNYGPVGLKIKSHIISQWRKIFIQDDTIFEIDKNSITGIQMDRLKDFFTEKLKNSKVSESYSEQINVRIKNLNIPFLKFYLKPQ